MKKAFLLLISFCILPVYADTVKTNNCLRNLYETQSEIKSVPETSVITKPKRKLFGRKQKQAEQSAPEVIVPIQQGGFVVFPNLNN